MPDKRMPCPHEPLQWRSNAPIRREAGSAMCGAHMVQTVTVTHAADRGEEEEIDSERDREGSRLLSKGEEGSPRAVGSVRNGYAPPE